MQKFFLKMSLFLNVLLLVYIFYYSNLAEKGYYFIQEMKGLIAQTKTLQLSMKDLSKIPYKNDVNQPEVFNTGISKDSSEKVLEKFLEALSKKN